LGHNLVRHKAHITGGALVDWIRSNGIGDVASIVGVIISICGFIYTFIVVDQSKKAAEAARDQIRQFESIVDFSAAIATLEEIKRLHRQGNALSILPDRYAAIRKLLIQLRGSGISISDEQKSVIQNALANLVEMEKQVEKALAEQTQLRTSKLNSIISADVDGLLTLLSALKSQPTGGSK
jgi:hypothetical protein